jgi:hypothetical protein
MNQYFNSAQMIEAYLRNELNPLEKSAFEQRISQDPLLQNELTLQSDIIISLQNYRKAELKRRLNQIDVSNASSPSNFLRNLGLFIALTTVLGIGTYLYLNRNEEFGSQASSSAPVTNTDIPVPASQEKPDHSLSSPNPSDTIGPASVAIAPGPPAPNPASQAIKESGLSAKSTPNKTTALKSEPTGSKVIRPENQKRDGQRERITPASQPSTGSFTEIQEEDKGTENGKIHTVAGKKPNGLNITFDDSPFRFHYTNKLDNLTLYGDFPRDYKKIKVNDQIYLYYEDSFYPIKTYQLEIAPLEKITDETLLEQLRKHLRQE